ncbi:hypothetical protein ACOMHN_030515 [Nucella lapillus]
MLPDQRSYAEVVKSANRSSTRGSPNPVAAEGGAHVPAKHREERYPPVDSSQVMTSSGDVYRRAESGESGGPPSSPLPDTRGAWERLQRYVYTGGPSTSGEQGELCSSPGRDRRAARERLQRDDYTECHPSTDKYGEPPPSPQGGTYARRGQPHHDVNTGWAPVSGPPPGTGASRDQCQRDSHVGGRGGISPRDSVDATVRGRRESTRRGGYSLCRHSDGNSRAARGRQKGNMQNTQNFARKKKCARWIACKETIGQA